MARNNVCFEFLRIKHVKLAGIVIGLLLVFVLVPECHWLRTKQALSQWAQNIDFRWGNSGEFTFDTDLNLFTIDGKPIVWLYWDHIPMPPYIQLSLETIKCHNFKEIQLIILNETYANKLINDTSEEISWLIPAHKADYFRSSILLKYGGMYLDADTIQLNSVMKLFKKLRNYDIFGYTWPPENAPIGITNAGPMRSRTLLLQRWKPIAQKVLKDSHVQLKNFALNQSSYPIGWANLLYDIWVPTMKDLLKKEEIRYAEIHGPSTYGQLVTGSLNILTAATKDNLKQAKSLNYSVEYFMYHNSIISGEWKSMTMTDFLAKKLVFTELIRKSLSQCSAWRNGQYSSELINKLKISTFNDFNEIL